MGHGNRRFLAGLLALEVFGAPFCFSARPSALGTSNQSWSLGPLQKKKTLMGTLTTTMMTRKPQIDDIVMMVRWLKGSMDSLFLK